MRHCGNARPRPLGVSSAVSTGRCAIDGQQERLFMSIDKTSDAKEAVKHIRLTSHPGQQGKNGAPVVRWGAASAAERGAIIGTTTNRSQRNVIGTHSGSYGVYRALAVAAGNLDKGHRADLTDTAPTDLIGPYPQWSDPEKMVSID